MAKKKPAEEIPPTDQDATQKLVDVLQLLTKEVETLNQQVGTLAEQSQVLTAAIDDVRQEMEISWPYYLHFLHLLTDQGIAAHAATVPCLPSLSVEFNQTLRLEVRGGDAVVPAVSGPGGSRRPSLRPARALVGVACAHLGAGRKYFEKAK